MAKYRTSARQSKPQRLEIILTTSDEVMALRARISELEQELNDLRQEHNRVELLYRAESLINLELQELLQANKIPYRAAIKKYAAR